MKNNLLLLPVLLLIWVASNGQSSKGQSNVDFNIIPCSDIKDAKATIKKAYLSQDEKYAPNDLEITDESIAWGKQKTKDNFWVGKSTLILNNSIYFDMMEKLCMRKNGGKYEIIFTSKSSGKKYAIKLRDFEQAVEGYSAIQCMIDKAKPNSK